MRNLDITGINKAELLAALFNNSRQQGMGLQDARGRDPLSTDAAQSIIDSGRLYFDYLYGRVLKVDLSGDTLDPWGYDRDLGDGATARIVNQVRNGS